MDIGCGNRTQDGRLQVLPKISKERVRRYGIWDTSEWNSL